MKDPLDVVRKLIALTAEGHDGIATGEATAAALKACSLIRKHGLELRFSKGASTCTCSACLAIVKTATSAAAGVKVDWGGYDRTTYSKVRTPPASAPPPKRPFYDVDPMDPFGYGSGMNMGDFTKAWEHFARAARASPHAKAAPSPFDFRADAEPIETRCPKCGARWYVGDRCPVCAPFKAESVSFPCQTKSCLNRVPTGTLFCDVCTAKSRAERTETAARRQREYDAVVEEARKQREKREADALEELRKATEAFGKAGELTAEEMAKMVDVMKKYGKTMGML